MTTIYPLLRAVAWRVFVVVAGVVVVAVVVVAGVVVVVVAAENRMAGSIDLPGGRVGYDGTLRVD